MPEPQGPLYELDAVGLGSPAGRRPHDNPGYEDDIGSNPATLDVTDCSEQPHKEDTFNFTYIFIPIYQAIFHNCVHLRFMYNKVFFVFKCSGR